MTLTTFITKTGTVGCKEEEDMCVNCGLGKPKYGGVSELWPWDRVSWVLLVSWA